ncbi:MAG: heparinase II/III family protein [Kiritimatiellae bacterium]|nr:heparinase II/III family protein [Kiritimatiellia bacterium]
MCASADETVVSFDSEQAISAWTLKGDVAIDPSKGRGDGGATLRVGPGGQALGKLRETDDSGTMDVWVFDDLTKPAKPKDRRAGPRWGLLQTDGRVLVMGAIYAPYLDGAKTYAASDSDQKMWFDVQYSALQRKQGWHRWTFTFDAEKGLSIALDGRKARFDWNRSKIRGFCGVAFFGDQKGSGAQTLWVDDLRAQLSGPMVAKPAPPPPPPPVTPEKDPVVENPPNLVPAVQGKHPRLLFTAEDIPAMSERIKGGSKPFMDQLVRYLGASQKPNHTKFLTDATDAQRQGFWRLPTVALHYALTGDAKSRQQATEFLEFLIGLQHWETGAETDSGMGAANIMAGAALAYDWLYDSLDPAFREVCRKKLLLQARRMYYRGHLMKVKNTHYWQNDPQNNHRAHRDAGLALCVLAAATGAAEESWILAETQKELQFVHDWLPPDGTYHEGPGYMGFGMNHTLLAFDAADRCLGTRYLEHPFFANSPLFRIYTLRPGLKAAFPYADCGGGAGFYNNFMLRCLARHPNPDLLDATLRFFDADPNAAQYGWFSVVWHDPSLERGRMENLPKNTFFPDLGLAYMRDGWEASNVGVMFKCGPYGGYTLNKYRNERDYHYINVAHDDPDANMFLLDAGGRLLASNDGYSKKKRTGSHNTILVNGKGQKGEGSGWTQPLKKTDMTRLSYVTTWKDAGAVVVVEGEAGAAYASRLTRYRRSLIWVPGSYVLVLDDIRAPEPAEITWLLQGPQVETLNGDAGHFALRQKDVACEVRVAADRPFDSAIGTSLADNRGKAMKLPQLQLKATAPQWRVASLYDPWQQRELKLSLTADGGESAVVRVAGPQFADTWQWQAAPDNESPSGLTGRRDGGFSVQVGPADKAPRD